jgi:hypothetical protein
MSYSPTDITGSSAEFPGSNANQDLGPILYAGNYYLATVDGNTGSSFYVWESSDQKTWTKIATLVAWDGVHPLYSNWTVDFDQNQTLAFLYCTSATNGITFVTFDLSTSTFGTPVTSTAFPVLPDILQIACRTDGSFACFFGQGAGADQGFNMTPFSAGSFGANVAVWSSLAQASRPSSASVGVQRSNGICHCLSEYYDGTTNHIIYVQVLENNTLNGFLDFGAGTWITGTSAGPLFVDEVNDNLIWSLTKSQNFQVLVGSGLSVPTWSAITTVSTAYPIDFYSPYLTTDGTSLFGMTTTNNFNQLVLYTTSLATPLSGWTASIVFDGSQVTSPPTWSQNNLENSQYVGAVVYFNNTDSISSVTSAWNLVSSPSTPSGPSPILGGSDNRFRIVPLPNTCCERELCLPMASSKEFLIRAD